MRREEFGLETRHVEPEEGEETAPLPTLSLSYDGPAAELRSALEGADGTQLAEEDLDVSLRLTSPFEVSDPDGVLAVTNRLTGDFVCELNVAARRLFEFLAAAKRRGAAVDGAPRYRLQFRAGDSPIRTVELDIFLVYTESGDLRESESLLPSSVEL
jgi:hypothetical protein